MVILSGVSSKVAGLGYHTRCILGVGVVDLNMFDYVGQLLLQFVRSSWC